MKNLLNKLSINIDKSDKKSLIISFLIINFAYLYHTLNFMWGNHDVKFIKEELLFSSGFFEGRFTQFIPYRLFVNGQILPILNNLIGFVFLTLALFILAKYWNLKKSTFNYVLFISFFATEPYTLSWLYFTFITISCLLWVLLAILALYISEHIKTSSNKLLLSFISIICFYLTLGGYPPIINTFFVCLTAKIVLSILFEKKSINELFHIHKYTILNIIIATLLFKVTLHFITPDNVYNLQTTPIKELPIKFISTLKISFLQFFTTLPFMEKGYKITLAIMSFLAIIGTLLTPATKKNKALTIICIIATIWFTSLTTFLVTPPTQYVSRVDFFGYGFLYAFFLCILLNLKFKIFNSLGVFLGSILLILNILNNIHALKVWKQGFDAEFKILDDITEKIESHPKFNPSTKYRFYQAGDISLRPSYYNQKFDVDDVFLHSIPYLAIWQGDNLVQFYSPYNYISSPSFILPSDITKEVYDFIMYEASPWPSNNSVLITNNIIIIIYNQFGLQEFRKKIKQIYPQ